MVQTQAMAASPSDAERAQAKAIERRVRTTNATIAVVVGGLVAMFMLYVLVAGDPAGRPPNHEADVELTIGTRGDATISVDAAWQLDEATVRRHALVGLSRMGFERTVHHSFQKSSPTVERRSNRLLLDRTHHVHLDLTPLARELAWAGVTKINYSLAWPRSVQARYETSPDVPIAPQDGQPRWKRRDASEPFAVDLTLRPSDTGFVTYLLVGSVGSLALLAAAIGTSAWRRKAPRSSRSVKRRFGMLWALAAGGGIAAMSSVTAYDDGYFVLHPSGWAVKTLAEWGPLTAFVLAGSWAALGLLGESTRATMRRQFEPGWRPDPWREAWWRWWDGARWTPFVDAPDHGPSGTPEPGLPSPPSSSTGGA